MPNPKAQQAATARYREKSVRSITVRFFPKDRDAYEYAKSKPKLAEYIISLIREDMGRSQ